MFPGYAYGNGTPIKLVCLLTSLAMLIRNECEVDGELQDKELRSCLLLVEQKLDDLLTSILRRDEYRTKTQIMKEVRAIVRKRKFDFSKVENHIKTLPDTKTKLQYLIEIQSAYSQQDLVDDKVSQNFGEKCRVEINKLERLMALKESDQSKNEAQAEADEFEGIVNGLSIRQRAMIMHYFFGQLGRNKPQFKPARLALVAALTGKKAENIKGIVAEPFMFKGSYLTEEKLEKDLGTIKPLFEALGLDEILKQIDRDKKLG
jgi:hypothetical protein